MIGEAQMALKLTFMVAALAVMFAYGMPTQVAKADARKSCIAQCKKTWPSPRGRRHCVQNCIAAKSGG